MSHEKKEGLAKQIQRQHKILDILLEQNDELRASLSYYQNLANSIIIPPHIIAEMREDENVSGSASHKKLYDVKVSGSTIVKLIDSVIFSGSANANFTQGINVSGSANANAMYGKNVFGKAYANAMQGKNVSEHAYANSMHGEIISGDANVEPAKGVQHFEHVIAEKINGINKKITMCAESENSDIKNVYGNTSKTNAAQKSSEHNANNDKPVNCFSSPHATDENNATTSPGTTSKELKEVKPIHLENLIFHLSFIIVRSNHKGLTNTAKILIRLHNSPKQSLKDLQTLTGLSDDGIGKRIVSMKRFGLITRAPGRQLLLTEKALRAIEKSRM